MASYRALPLRVGDEVTLRVECARSDTGEDWEPATASVVVFDPDRQTSGAADSGTASTLTDDARMEGSDFWRGLSLVVEEATSGQEYRTEITASAAGALTFGALPVAVEAGDRYTIEGYPLVPQTAAAVAGNVVSYQVTPQNGVTARPGRRVIVWTMDFSTDIFEQIWELDVLPSL